MMFAENYRVLSRVTPRFFVLWEGDTGIVNRDEEVLEQAGRPQKERLLLLVKIGLEVVGRHPS